MTICPITTEAIDAPLFRISIPAGARTGLESASQIMVDKIVSVPREAIDKTIGRCESAELEMVGDAIRGWLAL